MRHVRYRSRSLGLKDCQHGAAVERPEPDRSYAVGKADAGECETVGERLVFDVGYTLRNVNVRQCCTGCKRPESDACHAAWQGDAGKSLAIRKRKSAYDLGTLRNRIYGVVFHDRITYQSLVSLTEQYIVYDFQCGMVG